MKNKNKIFVTEHLLSCQKDFAKTKKFNLDDDKQEDLEELIRNLQEIDILKYPLDLTSKITGKKRSKETIPFLLGAGFHANRDKKSCCGASAHSYSLELDHIIKGGVPFVLIKDESLPCDIIITDETFSSYRFSCLKKEAFKKKSEEQFDDFRTNFCLKDPDHKIRPGEKPCLKEFNDRDLLKNLEIIIDAFDIKSHIVPVFPYSFYCNKLIWESFFGGNTFKQRANNNKEGICNYKTMIERIIFLAQYMESKNISTQAGEE